MTTRQKTKLRNAFENNMSTDIKLPKAQISKIIQSSVYWFIIVLLAKNISALLGITAAASAIDAGIQKKMHGSGTITLIISNEEMNEIMKIVQALEDSNMLLKGITKTIENEANGQKAELLGMLLGTLVASLLGNMLTGKGILRAGYGNKEGKEILRAGYGSRNF